MFNKAKVYLKVFYHHHREILSITEGILGFQYKTESKRSQLRRNIHRLEKGLIMRPLKEVFAEKYIGETIELYSVLSKEDNIDANELNWFNDVLDNYFNVVKKTEVITVAYSRYKKKESILAKETSSTPYEEKKRNKLNITFDELAYFIKRRRSIRFYEDKTPNIDDVKEAVDLASQAPSACNRQPFRTIYTNDKSKAVKIGRCAGGTTGYVDNIPSIMVVVGDLDYFNNPFDRHVPYIDSSLFTMQLLLSLEAKNLSSCVINWPDYKHADNAIRNILNLKNTERVMMLISIGYAKNTSHIPFSQKKNNCKLLEII